MQARREETKIYKVLKEKNPYKSRILYPVKIGGGSGEGKGSRTALQKR